MKQSAPYTLQFFTAETDHTIKLLDPGSITEWSGISKRIAIVFDELDKHPEKTSTDSKNIIQVLFVKNANLQNKRFYYNLCQTKELRTIKPILGAEDKREQSEYTPCPIITIGVHDIMSIYEEAPGLDFEPQTANWREQREQNKFLYKLRLDHRVKFLDSSIWHRYISLNSPQDAAGVHASASKDFDDRIEKLFGKIIGYYEQGLYESVAAVTTLEFQCRMLLNSFIDKAGDRGHHEAVTPFKFHSETVMEGKCERILEFMNQEREGGTRLSDLQWHLLMVDDHSNTSLSSIHLEKQEDEKQAQPLETHPKLINKKELIQQLLRLEQNVSTDGSTAIKIHDFTQGGTDIIKNGIEKLKEKSFDIILLDYLIGESEMNPALKAYGHEFLLEMATVPENGANLRRGPAGRFWIYPISSFPNAFTDKLRQLNIDGSNRQWFIANGGDPISTPELFRINFYRLILRQITEYYLHEVALERWTGQFIGIRDKDVWCKALELHVAMEEQKNQLLANDRNSSVFIDSMADFLNEQKAYPKFWEQFKKWIEKVSAYKKGQSPVSLLDDLSRLAAMNPYFSNLCNRIEAQVLNFVSDAETQLIKAAIDANKSERKRLEYKHEDADVSLYYIPEEIGIFASHLKELVVTNTKIERLPAAIGDLKGLKILDLHGNVKLKSIPAAILDSNCRDLHTLNLTSTVLAEKLGDNVNAYANTSRDVKNLLHAIRNITEDADAETQIGGKKTIFISYSHKAMDMKNELVTYLAPLRRDYPIDLWEDGQILPGSEWDKDIKHKLYTADIMLLLIDANFMASGYIHTTEIPAAFERWKNKKCTIIPIYLLHCDVVTSPILQLQGLPGGHNTPISSYVNRDEAWATVALGIRRAVEQLLPKK